MCSVKGRGGYFFISKHRCKMLPNKALQPTVKKLRFSPSAELKR